MAPVLRKFSFSFENPLQLRFGTQFFKDLPETPGVYFMRDSRGEILYIGKAKSLRARLKQYACAKPGKAAERTLEMIESVSKIDWQECESENHAVSRESELLHAVRPPFNIAGTEAEHYLFIGTRRGPKGELEFQLSSHRKIEETGYRVYGCYKHRPRIKSGYTAMMRLIHACVAESRRFSYPARITRASPPWLHSTRFPLEWEEALHEFLSGRSEDLLALMTDHLLESDRIPRFMYPSLQEDIDLVRKFYSLGPKYNFAMRRKHGVKTRIITHSRMDAIIASTIRPSTQRAT